VLYLQGQNPIYEVVEQLLQKRTHMKSFYHSAKVGLLWLFLLLITIGIKAEETTCSAVLFAVPVLVDDVFSTEEGMPVSGNLLANDIDPDGGSLNTLVFPLPPPLNGNVFMTSTGTFNYTPNPGFTGTDSFGYRACNENGECITATVTIYVWPAGCTPGVDTYTESSCDSCTLVCLEVAMLDLQNNYALTQNGGQYIGELTGCNFEAINAYSYLGLPGQGNFGPYNLTSWTVDGTLYTGIFNTPEELVDLLEQNDPAGEWFLSSSQLLIFGGNSVSTYSSMTVFDQLTSTTVSLLFNIQTIAKGTIVCLETGIHNLAFNPLDASCPETVANVTVSCAANPPITEEDAYTTTEGVNATGNVLDNDSDPDGGTLTVSITLISSPTNGTVIQNQDGTFTYIPNVGFVGIDTFEYEVCNNDFCSQAIVTITVESGNNPPIAVDDNYTINEGEVFTQNIVINDNEPDGDPTTASLVTAPSNGGILLSVNGSFTYSPTSGFIGVDVFTYALCDDQGLCDEATVTFNVIEVNDPPVAINDEYTILMGETLDGTVLTNDLDPEGDDLMVTTTTVSGPLMGIVTMNSDGTFNYLSPPNFTGTDQFIYEVCDTEGNCAQATVIITINAPNDAPVALDDTYISNIDALLQGNVSTNDTDDDETTWTFTLQSQTANGAVTLNSDGTFNYMPFGGFEGEDQFTYEVCDEQGICDQATVTITVETDCNVVAETFESESCDPCVYICLDVPFDNVSEYEITVDGIPHAGNILACNPSTEIAYTYFGLLGQGDEGPYELLSWTIDGITHSGTFADPQGLADLMNNIDPAGNWQVIPANFIVAGGVGNQDYSIMQVQNLAAQFSFSEIGFNGGFLTAGSAICVEQGSHVVSATLIGEVCPAIEINANINCSMNEAPIAVDDNFMTTMDVFVSSTIISNDTDPNGDALIINQSVIVAPLNGIVSIGSSGTFVYLPDAGFVGVDSFTYEVCDASGLCDQAVVTITILSLANTPPLAIDDNYTTDIDIPVMDNILTNDTDPDGDILTANTTLINNPTNGTVTLNADGTFTYTPNTGYTGVDMFTYEVCDPSETCDEAVVTITILPASCVPAEVDDITIMNALCTSSDGQITITIAGNVADYTFTWSTTEGIVTTEGIQLSDIPAGTYDVTITNTANSDCFMIQNGIVVGSDNDLMVDANIITQPYCGNENGEVNIEATDGSGNYTYEWTDGNTDMTRTDLAAGVYGITVTDSDTGCSAMTSVTLTDSGDCNEYMNIEMLQGTSLDTCLTALYDLPGTLTSAIVCYDNAMTILATVNQDDSCVNLTANADFVGVDTLCMFHCNDAGYCDTTMIIINVTSDCKVDFLGESELLLQADSCAGNAQYCMSIPLVEFQNYEVLDNGTPISASAGCDFDIILNYAYLSLIGQGELGPYSLESWTIDGQSFSGEFQTMSDLVDSMNVWNPQGEWTLNPAMNLIQGISGGENYSPMIIRHIQTNTSYDLGFNLGQYINSTVIELAMGSHEVIVTELATGCMDTVQVEVYCLLENTLYDTIMLDESDMTCFNIPTNLPGNIDLASLMNNCTDASGTSITFDPSTIDGTEICISYTGTAIGTDTACITICDDLGICETTTIIVTVPSDELNQISDTLYVGDVEVLCPEDFGFEDILDTAYNTCPDIGGEIATFEIDPASGCIIYTGIGAGQNIACLTFCDDLGNCNTTYLSVLVIDTTTITMLPIAVDDMDTTLQGIPQIIDIVENDTINGTLQTIIITENPYNGTVMIMGDSMILYTPEEGFCGQNSLMYMICNETGCDTATVIIDVECTEFEIFTAISPNGDGVNDYFVIRGIEQYNDVSVSIFNRWGNKVYKMNDGKYSNTMNGEGENPWNGTWNGKDLPDGTYFYFIDLKDRTGVKTGYVQLRR
jgi:gliding motility-associated-like protein